MSISNHFLKTLLGYIRTTWLDFLDSKHPVELISSQTCGLDVQVFLSTLEILRLAHRQTMASQWWWQEFITVKTFHIFCRNMMYSTEPYRKSLKVLNSKRTSILRKEVDTQTKTTNSLKSDYYGFSTSVIYPLNQKTQLKIELLFSFWIHT